MGGWNFGLKIKKLFEDIIDINIQSILTKYGIDNVEAYLKGNTTEPTTNYDNIDEWCELLNSYCEGGGYNVNQE